jgi:hypothetical protein
LLFCPVIAVSVPQPAVDGYLLPKAPPEARKQGAGYPTTSRSSADRRTAIMRGWGDRVQEGQLPREGGSHHPHPQVEEYFLPKLSALTAGI